MSGELFNENTYLVTARKWRPSKFEEVTSQEFITKTLRNAIKKGRVSHAYLFSGPRGVGKTTVARLLAKTLNCENPSDEGEPCNSCRSCIEISNDNRSHPDVFEIDGASNRNIEDIRELKEKVKYGPVRSKYKIFIIDEVHMLTGASFNALLKTLEEPPPYIVFIFATTAAEKVPLTIAGRCQRFDFKRLSIDEIKSRLKHIAEHEKISIDEDSLFLISKKADGSMRDAQGLFDMASAFCENNITYDKLKLFLNLPDKDIYFNISDLIKEKNSKGILNYFAELIDRGYEPTGIISNLAEHYRNILTAVVSGSADHIYEDSSVKDKYISYIGKFTEIEVLNSLKLIIQTEQILRYSSNQRTLAEVLLLELIRFTDTKDLSGLIQELKLLKSSSGDNKSDKKQPSGSEEISKEHLENQAESVSEIENNNSENKSETLSDQWEKIKNIIKKERRWVYSIIENSSFIKAGDGIFVIETDEDSVELLQGYHEYLNIKLSECFGHKISLKLQKQEGKKNSEKTGDRVSESLSKDPVSMKSDDNFEKLRSIIINEFGGREVNTGR
ncbi:MAG: DNA polymerase III subunit gamma/tau [Ignavibacteria bacterium]|nr:DNA polymerase III subunit gamma/tau [Ignavibacteria bacterium]